MSTFTDDYMRTEPEFRAGLDAMAARLGLDVKPLAGVMWLESRFSPAIRNTDSGATGLIQFMPNTARQIGTSVEDLARMSRTDQLVWVEKYFTGIRRKPRRNVPGDYYMAVFNPVHVGKPPDFVLYVKGSPGYDQNAGLDVDKDGKLTVGDVWRKILVLLEATGSLPLARSDLPAAHGYSWQELRSFLEQLSRRIERVESTLERIELTRSDESKGLENALEQFESIQNNLIEQLQAMQTRFEQEEPTRPDSVEPRG